MRWACVWKIFFLAFAFTFEHWEELLLHWCLLQGYFALPRERAREREAGDWRGVGRKWKARCFRFFFWHYSLALCTPSPPSPAMSLTVPFAFVTVVWCSGVEKLVLVSSLSAAAGELLLWEFFFDLGFSLAFECIISFVWRTGFLRVGSWDLVFRCGIASCWFGCI